ncbi:hypothetical protein [Ancylomarina sp. 16SWW S1-10-2]|uniref:hypothetical protein n=1 Tax=Ancylomarina sp. 16SWW S1-10-2 TaxID=2499681 RepID=UPI0012AD51AB|nr:hypothetical protein [Ancylomarina sp. 16SWW S1-10-2]MRT94174.1 hypothetical protein [Ancylomarina sp. 16SWW S1-10-2]
MSKHQIEPLFQLIKSMTKSEKRNFKLYANRIGSGKESKFIQVFDSIDKMEIYKEELIFKRAKDIKLSQLPNLKAHLYKQLLTSLRLTQVNHDVTINIREQIDHAKVLYNKGLYQQSLKMLEKSKALTQKYERQLLNLEIVEFEKLIESQYVTKSIKTRADEITAESVGLNHEMGGIIYFSNMSIRLYALYLKVGYARDDKDLLMVSEFFNSNIQSVDMTKLSFYEKLYLYQSYVWYYLIIQDFLMCYKYAQKWVDLFQQNPDLISSQCDLYLKALNNVLVALFYTNHLSKFKNNLELLMGLENEEYVSVNTNLSILQKQFSYMHQINLYFMEGRFKDGTALVPQIESFIEENKYSLDKHRNLVFYYKIACLYFGCGEYREAIQFLNKIIEQKDTSLRTDIHCFARILNLISHYELEHTDHLDYQIRSTYRFLVKMEDLQEVQKYILRFIRRLSGIRPDQLKEEFIKSRSDLMQWVNDPFEKRAFLYLDIISWLDSKIEKRPVQDVIMEKARTNK